MAKTRNPEELAQELDNLLGSSADMPDLEDDPLMSLANELSSLPQPQLSQDMRARMRQKVQQATQPKPEPAPSSNSRTIQFPFAPLLRWVAVFVMAVIMTSTVAYPAMADSLPGDILYPVKLTIESVELSLAPDEDSRAEVYLLQAERRLYEAGQLSEDNEAQAQLLAHAINNTTQAQQLGLSDSHIQSRLDSTIMRIQIMIDRAENVDTQQLETQLAPLLPTQDATPNVLVAPTQPTDTPEPTQTEANIEEVEDSDTPEPTITATDTPTDTPSETPTDEPTPEPIVGVVSAVAAVNVRTSPSTESDIVMQVIPGTIVNIIGESDDGQWLQVEFEDGTQGWIATMLIVEGTDPLFTIPTETEEEQAIDEASDIESASSDDGSEGSASSNGSTSVSGDSSGGDGSTDGSQTDSSASNQGNDGINKFGCDGRGNSCNNNNGNNGNGNSGNSGNNNGNGNSVNSGNSGNNGNGNGNSGNNGNGNS